MDRDLVLAVKLGYVLLPDPECREGARLQGARTIRYDPRVDASRRCRLVVAILAMSIS
jgi:hypothetical protein